jgi:hypothetical protein
MQLTARRLILALDFFILTEENYMAWIRITLTEESEVEDLRKQFLHRLFKTNARSICSAYVERGRPGVDFIYVYFSPPAAIICIDILVSYKSHSCDPPDPSKVESLGGHIDAMDYLRSYYK